MEEYINNPVNGFHILQHTLRSLCDENSPWIYAVFWRLLPRNHPPPTWDFKRGAPADRPIRENRKNWMLAWEDGFCNFFASTAESNHQASSSSSAENSDIQHLNGLHPQLFFKMSHEIHNYGEGLVGKVAADGGYKYVYECEQISLPAWKISEDQLHPKTWGPQFQSGIKTGLYWFNRWLRVEEDRDYRGLSSGLASLPLENFLTIALIAVDEGVLQLGAVRKVPEDFNYVVQLQKKFSHLLNIPGILLRRPSVSSYRVHSRLWFPLPTSINFIQNNSFKGFNDATSFDHPQCSTTWPRGPTCTPLTTMDHFCNHEPPPATLIPSMSSLDRLLCKLPSVVPADHSSPPLLHEDEVVPPTWLSFS